MEAFWLESQQFRASFWQPDLLGPHSQEEKQGMLPWLPSCLFCDDVLKSGSQGHTTFSEKSRWKVALKTVRDLFPSSQALVLISLLASDWLGLWEWTGRAGHTSEWMLQSGWVMGIFLMLRLAFTLWKTAVRMPSPGQQSRHISYDNPGLLTRAGLHQSHSAVSTDKTCRLSSEMLLLLLSHLFLYCPPSPSIMAHLQGNWTRAAGPELPRQGAMPACTVPQPSIQPDRWAACWGHPAGLKWVQAEGYRDCKVGEPTRHKAAESLWREPEASRQPGRQLPSSSRLVATPGEQPRLGPAGPLLRSSSWLRPKPESLGIPQAAKRALRVFPNPHCLMRSWKTWIFAFYTFAVDHIQVTA